MSLLFKHFIYFFCKSVVLYRSYQGVADYFNSPQIATPPVIIKQRKMSPPSHNKLENSDSPQMMMTPLISIAKQWRVRIN